MCIISLAARHRPMLSDVCRIVQCVTYYPVTQARSLFNGHSKINKKIDISTFCRIATPQNFILKFGTRDYVGDITHMQILEQIGSAGVSP